MRSCPKVYQLFTYSIVCAGTVFLQTLSPDAAKRQEDILLNVAKCSNLLLFVTFEEGNWILPRSSVRWF